MQEFVYIVKHNDEIEVCKTFELALEIYRETCMQIQKDWDRFGYDYEQPEEYINSKIQVADWIITKNDDEYDIYEEVHVFKRKLQNRR